MDTVLNSKSGPYIQTFYFEGSGLMIGFLHEEKTSESMAKTLDDLENKLGHDLYRELFPLILTDRGIEFEKVDLFEFNEQNTKINFGISLPHGKLFLLQRNLRLLHRPVSDGRHPNYITYLPKFID